MADKPQPDRGGPPNPGDPAGERGAGRGAGPGEDPSMPSDAETVVINKGEPDQDSETSPELLRERRFTAPGFDANETAIIVTGPDAETEVIPKSPSGSQPPGQPAPPVQGLPPKTAVPQSIPARDGAKAPASRNQKLGWVLAIIVIVLALTAIAVLLTVLLTRMHHPKASQEDRVRQTIRQLETALQAGDLATLRSITCGTTRDSYVDYDERAWQETYHRVAAAKQIPVIDTIDQVAVNGQHAEANVTTFMAYDPQVRSTRSIDLQFRDDQWKVCQSPSG
ncbi:hypothetical protein A5791_13340 [Mycobacterium sp. 852002-51163_SCH5372311]|uniref:Rv0361 family membrane protein n=1 Tax=Mycobacterium sp. 852002-51163_SCH5372311 TaxID=1834097 RepID=UPI0007FC063C|nr:hypothetical protein [Mycobacterium sp. 852002-51163_SCH5372311]OBF92853.1 hypothetical protein A5791_13340 [Mycobacterium sp. 852002-51163_SCH5372311]